MSIFWTDIFELKFVQSYHYSNNIIMIFFIKIQKILIIVETWNISLLLKLLFTIRDKIFYEKIKYLVSF